MVRIIFKNGEIMDCENVEKIYIENENIQLETRQIRDIIADLKEAVGRELGIIKDDVEEKG